MAREKIDYKQVVVKQKQAALDVVPMFILLGSIVGAAFLGSFSGIGLYALEQAQGGWDNSELMSQATILSAVVGAIIGIMGVLFASMFKDLLKNEYEKEFKIKLSGK